MPKKRFPYIHVDILLIVIFAVVFSFSKSSRPAIFCDKGVLISLAKIQSVPESLSDDFRFWKIISLNQCFYKCLSCRGIVNRLLNFCNEKFVIIVFMKLFIVEYLWETF